MAVMEAYSTRTKIVIVVVAKGGEGLEVWSEVSFVSVNEGRSVVSSLCVESDLPDLKSSVLALVAAAWPRHEVTVSCRSAYYVLLSSYLMPAAVA